MAKKKSFRGFGLFFEDVNGYSCSQEEEFRLWNLKKEAKVKGII